ncbi:MAG: hypothetical protein IAI49_08355 [Candidatus Eremiobacteraeota bacterium]|nr:hypothetical protein [Candidatus Eremiobacteraeota bacterium]
MSAPAPATLDILNASVQIATLLVFGGTAVAALFQIRHLRASNELDALLRITEQLRSNDLQSAFRYVQTELDAKIADPLYRRELGRRGFVDARQHPEMNVCNWFNEVGTLVKNRLIDERTFLDLFSRLVTYYWTRLEPVIAVLRRERGAGQYENFEYLSMLALRWQALHPNGAYPRRAKRLHVADVWKDADAGP